jgi:signal transduction histidine kinase
VSTTQARIWAGSLLAFAVGFFGVWQALRSDAVDSDQQVVMAVLLAVAAGSYRLLPSLGLALVWLACVFQIELRLELAVVQLAVVFVAYGTARYGQPITAWISGLSIPVGAGIALWYVYTYGYTGIETLGLAVSPSGRRPGYTTAFLLAFVVLASPWAVGLLLRITAQTRQAREDRERAEVEAARAQEIARLREEQTRVARDVHDIVGHSLAVILAQADSAQYMDDTDVSRIRTALSNISTSARQSLGDVRQVLSTTGASDGSASPGTGGLDRLIDGVSTAGYDVSSEVVGTPRSLPPELDAVAFRVLQEMLTNALKHGTRDGGIAVVREWGQLDLRIEVTNAVVHEVRERPDGGLGLAGMQRRLESVGGRLAAGPSRAPDGSPTFRAEAWVPLRDTGRDRGGDR